MKALEILKVCRERGQKRAGGISLDEAIAELEALQQPNKSCEVCKYFDRFKCLNKHSIAFEAKYGVCNSDYCNKHELKDEQ